MYLIGLSNLANCFTPICSILQYILIDSVLQIGTLANSSVAIYQTDQDLQYTQLLFFVFFFLIIMLFVIIFHTCHEFRTPIIHGPELNEERETIFE